MIKRVDFPIGFPQKLGNISGISMGFTRFPMLNHLEMSLVNLATRYWRSSGSLAFAERTLPFLNGVARFWAPWAVEGLTLVGFCIFLHIFWFDLWLVVFIKVLFGMVKLFLNVFGHLWKLHRWEYLDHRVVRWVLLAHGRCPLRSAIWWNLTMAISTMQRIALRTELWAFLISRTFGQKKAWRTSESIRIWTSSVISIYLGLNLGPARICMNLLGFHHSKKLPVAFRRFASQMAIFNQIPRWSCHCSRVSSMPWQRQTAPLSNWMDHPTHLGSLKWRARPWEWSWHRCLWFRCCQMTKVNVFQCKWCASTTCFKAHGISPIQQDPGVIFIQFKTTLLGFTTAARHGHASFEPWKIGRWTTSIPAVAGCNKINFPQLRWMMAGFYLLITSGWDSSIGWRTFSSILWGQGLMLTGVSTEKLVSP